MKANFATIMLLAAVAVMAGNTLPACGATDNGGSDSDSDSDSDTDTDSDSDGDDTIYDVQQGNVAEDSTVTFNNVIVTSPVHGEEGGVFIEEPAGGEYSGIYLYLWSDVIAEAELEPGMEINVTGQYTEFFGYSEVTVQAIGDLEVLGTADIPAAEVVDPADVCTDGSLAEAYEGVLVKIESPEVTDGDLGYGQWEADGSLVVDDFFFDGSGGPSEGAIYPDTGDTFDAVTGVMYLSFDEVKLEPRFAEDYEGFSGGDTDTDTDTDTDADADIFDIQQGLVDEDTLVEITGAVVTSPVSYNGEDFFIQDPAGGQYSGILVHNFDGANTAADVEVGDEVTVSGFYVEYFELSEITVSDASYVTVTGTATVPAPAVVSSTDVGTSGSLAEAYEGVLITVEDVEVTTAADGYGQFIVDSALMVDDMFFTGGSPDPTVGTTYTSITGPLNYNFDDFKIEPRTTADLVE